MKLVVAPQAASDIETIERWWVANRPAAPQLFEAELAQALELIFTAPLAGAPLHSSRLPGVRRVGLPKSRYLVYYRVLDALNEVRVLRVWHMSRGRLPKL